MFLPVAPIEEVSPSSQVGPDECEQLLDRLILHSWLAPRPTKAGTWLGSLTISSSDVDR
ncbi:hypothetical protein QNO07_27045 [Streptomyces sp. 549]|uniref:hypothetical protein n=1 Tax=Streptomyces sp. 549 TaxID=3049076 RepID=UPI0024C20E1A|nr:hypothetical protein [Streptomyces sp. 549]MDK1477007.1 hypothetical protein [Streptomyces sp. 549]